MSCGEHRIYLELLVRRVSCRSCGRVKRERLTWLADNPNIPILHHSTTPPLQYSITPSLQITAPSQPQETRKGTWESAGLHPTCERARLPNRLSSFEFSAFSAVKLLRQPQKTQRTQGRELRKALVFTRHVSSRPTMSATPLLHHSITPSHHAAPMGLMTVLLGRWYYKHAAPTELAA